MNTIKSDFLLVNAYLESDPIRVINLITKYPLPEIKKFLIHFSGSSKFPALMLMLSNRLIADCLEILDKKTIIKTFKSLKPEKIAGVILSIEVANREKFFEFIPDRYKNEVQEIISYPNNTAGSIMSMQIPIFSENMSVGESIKKIRSGKYRDIEPIYVVDTMGKFIGGLSISELLKNKSELMLNQLTLMNLPTVSPMSIKEEIVETSVKLKCSKLPVVNAEQELLGVVLESEIFNTVQEDALAKIQAMSGASKDENALSSPFFAIKKRILWLNINLVTVFLAAGVIGMFEHIIAKFTALAVLLPVVAGQSGNTGAQALAVVMRGLSLREIRVSHWPRIFLKELFSGMGNGFIISLVCGIAVYVWSQSLGLSIVAFVSMIFAMTLSSISGAMVPIILRIFNQDPAQSSSIILTTITDTVSFFSFLGLATFMSQFITLA